MLCSPIMLDGPVPENNFRMSSSFVYRHDDGYQCDLKGTDQGWALIVSGFMPVDERFNRNLDDREWKSCKALDGRPHAFGSAQQSLWLVEDGGGGEEILYQSTAEQFSGLSVCDGDAPVYLWTERSGGDSTSASSSPWG